MSIIDLPGVGPMSDPAERADNPAREYPQDDPRGWAVALDGKFSLRTASYRPEAAMINGLVLYGGVNPATTGNWSDVMIRSAWESFMIDAANNGRKVELIEVICMPVPEPLPAGAVLSADQGSAAVTIGESIGNHQQKITHPEMLGIACRIQHPLTSGKPPVTENGLLGAGVVINGDYAVIMVQMKHPDGTSLGAILSGEEFASHVDTLIQVGKDFQLATASVGRKPS